MSIREVNAVAITDVVEELCIRANTQLPPDVKQALDNAHAAEPWPLARQLIICLLKLRPIPLPSSLVVKKGIKICSAASGSITGPLLAISICTLSSSSQYALRVISPSGVSPIA